MVFERVLGNIKDIENINNYHVEKIILKSDDLLKRIIRVTSDHGHEYGISLDKGKTLNNGDILLKDGHNLVIVQYESNDILVIKPTSINEMGKIAHALGNRHLPAQFENDTMIVEYDNLVEDKLKHDNINYSRENRVLEKAFRHVEFEHRH
ncbi:urease accessory protein UreE [Sarcina ventriculi]|uniref:urease accessory protein UreE n=1 Tax=Sarcina ventriculi TaxID=1267 RepID=UPI0018AA7395|nr:urease accessory protein UreE [Sarcina ventriculi]